MDRRALSLSKGGIVGFDKLGIAVGHLSSIVEVLRMTTRVDEIAI